MATKMLKRFVEVKGRTSNGRVTIDCAFCDGEGETKTRVYPYKRVCPACKGSKKFTLSKPLIVCIFCSGQGRDKKDPKVTCLVCGGKGANSIKKGYKVCKDCSGSGNTQESRLPCVTCRGTGVC